MIANNSQCRPTTTNAGQHIPMKAHSSQCRPTNRNGPNDVTHHLDPGMFSFFFIHSFTNDILYIRPMQANKYQQNPTAANTSQQMVTGMGPNDMTCHLDPGMFLFYFIHSFTIDILYIRPMQANNSQWRPTHTNTYQQKPTAANSSQQMVTGIGLNDVACHLGPICFYFFIYSFTIDILYISVHWANAGQQRSMMAFIMQANEDQQKPTVASTG